jgi:hypothetical protein
MALTLKQRQQKLDLQKWVDSKKQGFDMSGCMLYCEKCEFANHSHPTEHGKCYATQEQRESQCLCAKAYNKRQKTNKKA